MSIRAAVRSRAVVSCRHNSVHRLRTIRSAISLLTRIPRTCISLTRIPLTRIPLTRIPLAIAHRLLDGAQYNAIGEGQRRGRPELAQRRRRRHRHRPALVTHLWGDGGAVVSTCMLSAPPASVRDAPSWRAAAPLASAVEGRSPSRPSPEGAQWQWAA
jgi:hypothetical protein